MDHCPRFFCDSCSTKAFVATSMNLFTDDMRKLLLRLGTMNMYRWLSALSQPGPSLIYQGTVVLVSLPRVIVNYYTVRQTVLSIIPHTQHTIHQWPTIRGWKSSQLYIFTILINFIHLYTYMYADRVHGIWTAVSGQFVASQSSQVCAAWRGSLGDGLQLDVERNGAKMFVCPVCIHIQ